MHENMLSHVARLSDDALLARLEVLALRERDATVELVAHLAELDGRRAHLSEGPGSVYGYCRNVLGYSEDAAWNRAATASAVRRYPVILGWLADGSLNITTVRMLKAVLTPENHLAVLAEARHRGKKEVELIQRRLDPKPDVPSTIRKVDAPSAVVCAPVLEFNEAVRPSPLVGGAPPVLPDPSPAPAGPAPAPRPVVGPLTPDRYRVQFTVSKQTYDKLRHIQNLLCREIPGGDPAVIFDRALDLLASHIEKKKLAATKDPRPPRATKDGSRDIPAQVKRTVWKRDGGQRAFEGKRGRCTERRFLEWHHVQPFGHQGPATVENISLRCRAHNVYESEMVFGRIDRPSSGSHQKTARFPGNSRRSGTAGQQPRDVGCGAVSP